MIDSTRSRRRGFTLVELLVVIGIIAVLIGILLPSLSKARQSAQTTQCLANLRQIVTASINYTTDYKGAMIPAEIHNGKNTIWWPALLMDGGYLTGPPRIPAANFSTAPPVAGKSVLFCPSAATDVQFTGAQNSPTYPATRQDAAGDRCIRERDENGDCYDYWYGINAGTDSTTTYDVNSQGPPVHHHQNADTSTTVNQINFNKMNVVHHSSEMVFFFDGQIDSVAGEKVVNPSRVSCRHNNRTRVNLAFFDGHASTILGSDLPGKFTPQPADMKIANLLNYPSPQPMWLLDQDSQ